ncbi:MAG: redoxin domain-containing protein [Defluviitaleaceae bacterium]|nr:redoxin domain-containing protein [Defluviitaleaceae bacterium]
MTVMGKKVNPFEVDAFVNGKMTKVSQKDFEGKWAVFFFYPADFTFVCPTELEDLADLHEDFKKIGCEIFSVSTDTHFTHKAWWESSPAIKKVKYPMLGDPAHIISEDFGVLIPGVGLARRGTFIVSPEGEIIAYEIAADGMGRVASETLRKVQAAQFLRENPDSVCPAKWKPGDEVLKPAKLLGALEEADF